MKKKFKLEIFTFLCCVTLTNQSCTSLDDVNNRIDQVVSDVNNLEAAIKLSLRTSTAFYLGKISNLDYTPLRKEFCNKCMCSFVI